MKSGSPNRHDWFYELAMGLSFGLAFGAAAGVLTGAIVLFVIVGAIAGLTVASLILLMERRAFAPKTTAAKG